MPPERHIGEPEYENLSEATVAAGPGGLVTTADGKTYRAHPAGAKVDRQFVDNLEASVQANPKDLVGAKKAPLRLVPPALVIAVAPVMQTGADKYGAYNWRTKPVRATSYTEATLRHLLAWQDGQDVAEDSGLSHLAHAAACLAILLDAQGVGCMIDDRPTPGPAAQLLADLDQSGR